MTGKTELSDTVSVKVKGISIVFRRVLNKLNELESKSRIICGDCYIDFDRSSVVWRSRGKKHLRLVDTLSAEDTGRIEAFFRKVLPAAEKKMDLSEPLTTAPKPAPVIEKGQCLTKVGSAIARCPDYSDCWSGIYLKDDNKCGYKGTARPRSEPTQAPGYSERAKPT